MAYGLQVFDSSGNLEIDISSRLGRFIQNIRFIPNIPEWFAANNTMSIYYPGISNDGTWVIINANMGIGFSLDTTNYIIISISYGVSTNSDNTCSFDIFRI